MNALTHKLGCPVPDFGTAAVGVYNAGPGLADDTKDVTPEDSYMMTVKDVTKENYDSYKAVFKDNGYTEIFENKLSGNLFSSFSKDGIVVHLAYFSVSGELHITEDRCSVTVADFAYDKKGSARTEIYQYGLYYDPENRDNTGYSINCGMIYIIRLSDNSLIMVDGGHIYQCSDEAMNGLWAFMKQITSTSEDGTVKVAAWYITHAHSDHVTGCAKLLNHHHDQIDLQRVMYNMPSYQTRPGGYDEFTTITKESIRKYYPSVQFLKLHTGQDFSLSDVRIEVLYTHEDALTYDTYEKAEENRGFVPFPLRDYNCSSSIIRFYVDGKSFLMLGDTNVETERIVSTLTAPELWKSDAVQIAHHCFNYLNSLYPRIAAPLAMLPNSYYGGHTPENTPKLATVLEFVKDDQIYYEGEETTGICVENGEFTAFYHAPVIGTIWDNSGL